MRYTGHNLRLPHDLHYSWTGWPAADTALPAEPPLGLLQTLTPLWRGDGLTLEAYTWQADAIHLTFAAGPELAPVFVAQRAKGRLQHALRQALSARPVSPAAQGRGGLGADEPPSSAQGRGGLAPGGFPSAQGRGGLAHGGFPSAQGCGGLAPGGLVPPEPKAQFSRKVSVRAIGHNLNVTVERYIRDQLVGADLADPRYCASLARAAVADADVDLDQSAETNSGRYWYNLHIVLVTANRFRFPGHDQPSALRDRVRVAAHAQGCVLKALAVMPDHLHAAMRGDPERSPAEIGIAVQNATAEVPGCRLWQEAFYVGTFGAYDLAAVH
jgi:REP element-mobilizing transposase RayT